LRAVRSFCRWMVKVKRIPADPLDSLELLPTAGDVRHARRELSADELPRLLAFTRASARTFRGLDGPARYHLYALACGTACRAASEPVWPGTWASDKKAALMLRKDLEAAGIPYAVESPDGPLYADFHALRHTYLTLGGRAGIDLRTLQELAGHSNPALTARYSHRRLHDLAGAVEKLPPFLPTGPGSAGVVLAATGTDGASRPISDT